MQCCTMNSVNRPEVRNAKLGANGPPTVQQMPAPISRLAIEQPPSLTPGQFAERNLFGVTKPCTADKESELNFQVWKGCRKRMV